MSRWQRIPTEEPVESYEEETQPSAPVLNTYSTHETPRATVLHSPQAPISQDTKSDQEDYQPNLNDHVALEVWVWVQGSALNLPPPISQRLPDTQIMLIRVGKPKIEVQTLLCLTTVFTLLLRQAQVNLFWTVNDLKRICFPTQYEENKNIRLIFQVRIAFCLQRRIYLMML